MTATGARAVLDRFGTFADRFTDCFGRQVQRDAAGRYLRGLLNGTERKSMQAMHGRLSDPHNYHSLQHFITDSPWDAAPLWRRIRDDVLERRGIVAVDDTGLPKQGTHSVGVQRQSCGALGKIANCQIAVTTAVTGLGRSGRSRPRCICRTRGRSAKPRRVAMPSASKARRESKRRAKSLLCFGAFLSRAILRAIVCASLEWSW